MSPQPAKQKLTRAEAIGIVQSSKFMVAVSDTALAIDSIHVVEYEVYEQGKGIYKFEPQPFRIMRRINKIEYYNALPIYLRRNLFTRTAKGFYYEIATD